MAEVARLGAALARAGQDTERALAETAAAREEARRVGTAASDAAADHAREAQAGRTELAGAEALSGALRRANAALEAGRAALAESEERLRAVVESAADYAIITTDRQGRITGWNRGASNVLGWAESEVLRRDAALIFTPEDRATGVPEEERRTALQDGRAEDERWQVRRDGSRFWAVGQLTPLRDGSDGPPRGFLKILRDRTERREAARERERLLTMLGQSQVMVCDWEGRVEVWSQGMERLFGFAPAEAVGAVAWGLLRGEPSQPWPEVVEALRREGRWVGEVRHRAKDGSPRIVQETWLVQPGLDGGPSSLVAAVEDRTAARQAEAALQRLNETLEAQVEARTAELRQAVDALHAEALERERAEEQLRQAQKMEAVGQLTGGIAHDFNNMLQAIGGALEMLHRRGEQGRAAEAGRYLEGARKTVERAAALTHRLLAFARRQQLQPRPVKPDLLVEGVAELIRRTVGPGVQVELRRTSDGVWTVLCDPNQLENVLLNLAINARDAMPDGGRLTICTEGVRLSEADVAGQEGAEPGDYVEIAVGDTGTGMSADVLARAFEPFFTTKPLGQGTGLGLSQLYGFVRQSSGVVRLDSAPGRGTTVRLYLPRHERAGGGEEAGPGGTVDALAAAAGATVLLVEDEAQVREVAAEALRELGYHVVEAGDGPAAVRVLHGSRGSEVDLLVTDVGLPGGLNGRQLAEIARERRPGLPVLFITGYAGAALDGQLAPGMEVIGKPFALDALAARVQRMVEGKGTGL